VLALRDDCTEQWLMHGNLLKTRDLSV
jgi:hypothetical protein